MTRPSASTQLIAATWLLLAGCGDHAPEPAAHPPDPAHELSPASSRSIQPSAAIRARLHTEPVAKHSVPDVVTAPGEVAVDLKQVAQITSRIEGQIEQIHVQLGDRVRKGQRLAAIGSLQLDQLIEEYLVAKAQADVAENSFRRTETLRANDIVPEKKLIEDKGRYLETTARYQHIREKLLHMGLSNVELAALERGLHDENHRYTLTAPIGGTVVAQHAVRGQGVAPGNALFEIVDTSRVWVFANLSIEQARKFKEGDRGTILAKGADAITAPLTYLAPIADETTRTIQARFEVDNAQGQLKPREYVEVTLTLPGAPVLALPASALTAVGTLRGAFIEQGAAYLFVPLELGRESGDWVEVKRGVNEQDRVVTAGAFDLKNILLKEQIGTGD
ncbi:MAG: efflux RND transporter periplasmic adaptor subunit [Nitrospira sp.]|nr:efflux RND transporter periplasmic adaptor subunit [Nitrospira sp.]